MFTDTRIREVFHFCFLDRLLKLSDPSLYVLKGGVNLRFFFGSPRYSEDMDIDVLAGGVHTLKKNGYKILNDGAFQRSLRVCNVYQPCIKGSDGLPDRPGSPSLHGKRPGLGRYGHGTAG